VGISESLVRTRDFDRFDACIGMPGEKGGNLFAVFSLEQAASGVQHFATRLQQRP
jgi:hypothetical protein